MNEISTPFRSFTIKSQYNVPSPKPETLTKIRQFARAYTNVRRLGKLGNIICN